MPGRFGMAWLYWARITSIYIEQLSSSERQIMPRRINVSKYNVTGLNGQNGLGQAKVKFYRHFSAKLKYVLSLGDLKVSLIPQKN